MENREINSEKQIKLGIKIYEKFVDRLGIGGTIRTPHTDTLQEIYLFSKFKNKRYIIYTMLEELASNFKTDRKFILRDGEIHELVEYIERPSDYDMCDKYDKKIKVPK